MRPVSFLLFVSSFLIQSGYGRCQTGLLIPENSNAFKNNRIHNGRSLSSQSITDTVIFNLAVSYQISGNIEIPVSFHSSDTVYALDFAFQYNEQIITIDSVICPLNGMQYLYHYNPFDSTFRFTSNCLTPMPDDSVLVRLFFHVFSGPICTDDIYNTESWLNGNGSTSSIINCIVSGNYEIENSTIAVWPVPANSFLHLHAPCMQKIALISINGREENFNFFQISETDATLDVSFLDAGVYFLKLICNSTIYSQKIIVAR